METSVFPYPINTPKRFVSLESFKRLTVVSYGTILKMKLNISIILLVFLVTLARSEDSKLSDNVDTATQNFIGIDCIVNSIYGIEDATANFEFEIVLCDSNAKEDASDIFDEIENLKDYTQKVQDINDTTCKNKNSSQKNKTTKSPSAKCVKNIKNAIMNVSKSVNITIKRVNAYHKETSSGCAKMSLLTFKLMLKNFDATIAECASVAADAAD